VNVKVNLFKRVRTSTGLRCCPVVELKNHRIKAHAAIVDGVEEEHKEGVEANLLCTLRPFLPSPYGESG
jgi:hypothetical protein